MTNLNEKLEKIVEIPFPNKNKSIVVIPNAKKEITKQTKALIKQVCLEVIGEDEKPEKEVKKALTMNYMDYAANAVKFHASNELRKQQKTKLEELIK